jgi:hypothetical protein
MIRTMKLPIALFVAVFLSGCNLVDRGTTGVNTGQDDPDTGEMDVNGQVNDEEADATADADDGVDVELDVPVDPPCPAGRELITWYGLEICAEPAARQSDPAGCDDTPVPARCHEETPDEDVTEYPAVLSMTVTSADCCIDFTEDGNEDNAVASLVASDVVREEVTVEIFLPLFHLKFVDTDEEPFAIHWLERELFIGSWTAASFDEGSHPRSLFPEVTYLSLPTDQQMLLAMGGRIHLRANRFFYYGAQEEITLRNAILYSTTENTVDPFDMRAFLGATIRSEDIAEVINAVSARCACADVVVSVNDDARLSCQGGVDVNADGCSAECQRLETACLVTVAINGLLDVDTTGDGQQDSLSAGFRLLIGQP